LPNLPATGLFAQEALESEHITRTLEANGRQISGVKGVAAILGMNPNTLRYRML
jgi:formate hydrogenlyase transcriptional activator